LRLWGGNYSEQPDAGFWEFNRSFGFDRRLLYEEVAASRAYVRALQRCGVLGAADAEALDKGLAEVFDNAVADPLYLEVDSEDVHSFVEERLGEIVGDLAGQMHVGRSRNEQAVTALRLWVRGAIDELLEKTAALVEALARQGEAGAAAVMPGYTHMRPAEPITLGHFLGAHAWALVRDRERLHDARRRVNVLPLGSGALAGTAPSPTVTSRPSSRSPAPSSRRTSRAWPTTSSASRRPDRPSSICPRRSPPAPASCRRRRTRTRWSWCAASPRAWTRPCCACSCS
jgi:argininosuccinate lyase